LCFGAKLHSTQVTGMCLYPFGVPEDRTVIWWSPENEVSCVETRWSN